jgi:hypothetical protein
MCVPQLLISEVTAFPDPHGDPTHIHSEGGGSVLLRNVDISTYKTTRCHNPITAVKTSIAVFLLPTIIYLPSPLAQIKTTITGLSCHIA